MFITSTILKLAIATFLGMILGLERELKRKPLGLKTNTVICVASCLITIVSIESAYQFPKMQNITMDPLRLAAQIVSGVGFLGAGVILVKGMTVTGLTTAAMMWGASGIGIAVGAGFWEEASIALGFMIISVELLPVFLRKIGPGRLREKELELIIIATEDSDLDNIQTSIKSKEIIIHHVRIRDMKNGNRQLTYSISTYENRQTTAVYEEIRSIKGIRSVELATGG
ncbi:MgtC/SapB family protein [Ectobacillus sp. sgz5001026]|uniref:MgtC/SapB family protein n=1 Tax=Ectobacillus sp. sgz5001026 TaxID=3242473 RepID=UPI0036D372A9